MHSAALQTIQAQEEQAAAIGVQGVPFFIFNGCVAVSGAQEPPALLEAMRQALRESADAPSAVTRVGRGLNAPADWATLLPWLPEYVLAHREVLLLAPLGFAGAFIYGITGFGSALVTIPIGSMFVPLPFTLAVWAVVDLFTAMRIGLQIRVWPWPGSGCAWCRWCCWGSPLA
jgi:hypothetical protein